MTPVEHVIVRSTRCVTVLVMHGPAILKSTEHVMPLDLSCELD